MFFGFWKLALCVRGGGGMKVKKRPNIVRMLLTVVLAGM